MTREEIAVRLLTGQKLICVDWDDSDEYTKRTVESSEQIMVEAAFRLADTILKFSKESK